jgi:hypothetical protein
MADRARHTVGTLIERIEIEHADEAGVEDINRGAALSTETKLGARYFLDLNLIGSLFSLSLASTTAFWGFGPPAAVLTFIAADIGKESSCVNKCLPRS